MRRAARPPHSRREGGATQKGAPDRSAFFGELQFQFTVSVMVVVPVMAVPPLGAPVVALIVTW